MLLYKLFWKVKTRDRDFTRLILLRSIKSKTDIILNTYNLYVKRSATEII